MSKSDRRKAKAAAVISPEKLAALAAEAEAWDKGPVSPGTWEPAPEALIPPGTKVEIRHIEGGNVVSSKVVVSKPRGR